MENRETRFLVLQFEKPGFSIEFLYREPSFSTEKPGFSIYNSRNPVFQSRNQVSQFLMSRNRVSRLILQVACHIRLRTPFWVIFIVCMTSVKGPEISSSIVVCSYSMFYSIVISIVSWFFHCFILWLFNINYKSEQFYMHA